jgi:hypothetical protein
MDNDKTRYMFHVETKGYEDEFEYRSYPDIILTEYATFNGAERWHDVVRAFTRFLSNVYGYDIEQQFNEMYIDPLTKREEDTKLDLFKDQ